MLRPEQNDFLTQTGQGTPMGEMFRRYWIPALLAEELPESDCPPVRVQLLSEKLLAFRDSNGRLGLIESRLQLLGQRARGHHFAQVLRTLKKVGEAQTVSLQQSFRL